MNSDELANKALHLALLLSRLDKVKDRVTYWQAVEARLEADVEAAQRDILRSLDTMPPPALPSPPLHQHDTISESLRLAVPFPPDSEP